MNEKERIKHFANFISNQLKWQQLSLRGFARRSGLSSGYLSNLENAKRGIPKTNTLDKLAKGLRIDKSILYNEAGLDYLVDNNSEPYVEKQNINGKECLTYKGKILDQHSIVAIQRILDTMP